MKDCTEFYAREEDYPWLDIDACAKRLSKAIRCRTVNDRQNYAPFEQLQAHMRASYPHVMSYGSFETVGHSVLITLPGSDSALRPCLFMSHQDVVPVVEGTENDWTHPAFSGDIADGYIWGRGTLDIKEQVFGLLEAAEYLLSRGERLRRTAYLAFGDDEETYNTGAQGISDLLKSRGVRLEFVLDEGGAVIRPGTAYGAPGCYVSPIALMEKGYADLLLSVKSAGGHSSRPFGGTSLGKLSGAIARICDSALPPRLSPVIRLSFEAMAPYITKQPLRKLVKDIDANADEIARYCLGVEELFPFVTTTIAPTMIRGGSAACNVMPQNMEAVINFRLAWGDSPEELMERCRRAVADPSVGLSFLQANPPSAAARTDGYGYRSLQSVLGKYFPGVVFIPSLTAGATDAHCYEQLCDTCLRFTPFIVNAEESARGVHGTNERLPVRTYAQGIRVLIALMEKTCVNAED